MKILVCISHVPDTTAKIQFDAAGQEFNKTGVKFIVGPYDDYCTSWAAGAIEKDATTHLTILCVGGAEVEPTLRSAIAVAGNELVRIDSAANDAYSIAFQIAEYAKEKKLRPPAVWQRID